MSDNDNAMKLKVAIGSDHAGYPLKEEVANLLRDDGYEITDLGTFSIESVDYPDIAVEVSTAVARGEFDRGILICGTGIGMTIAANKVPGIRAAATSDVYSARMARAHNNANVVAIGVRQHTIDECTTLVDAFLDEPFSGDPRHQRRIDLVSNFEGR